MVEFRENNQSQETNTTPETITTSMILEDLESGVDRTGIKAKYNLETWEVKQMFDHPKLKGKKAKKIRKLSFNFVDDVNEDVLPGQIDIEDAIKAELENESMKDAVIDEMNGRQEMDAQDQIAEMKSEDVEESEVEVLEEDADNWANETNY